VTASPPGPAISSDALPGGVGMDYEGVEYVVRAGLGRNEWAIVIHFPGASEALARSSVVRLQGTREKANSVAHERTRNWLKRQRLMSGAASQQT
jgi:hypothetical protein